MPLGGVQVVDHLASSTVGAMAPRAGRHLIGASKC